MSVKKLLLVLLALLLFSTLLFSCDEGSGDDEGASEGGEEGGAGGEGGEEDAPVTEPEPKPDTTVYDSDPDFDYLTSDLSSYIELPESAYLNYTCNLKIAKPKLGEDGGLSDVDIYILSLLRAAKSEEPASEGFVPEGVIGAGDFVKIYYRGYVVGDDGELTEKAGMCNFKGNAQNLEIGSGNFVPGFELNLVGKNPKDYARFSDLDGEGKLPEGKTALTVECYFPYNYHSADLQNKNAIFEVYVEGILDYTAPDWDTEFLTSYLEGRTDVTEEKLREYEGENICEQFEAYYAEKLLEGYESQKESLAMEALAESFFGAVKVLKYPKVRVEGFMKPYVDEITASYEKNGGILNGNTYSTLASYACAYLDITMLTADWQGYLRDAAKSHVSQRLVIYYIMKELDLLPTKTELDAKVKEIKGEYYAEYARQMLEIKGKTPEEATDEEYAALIEEAKEIFDDYGYDYFADNYVYETILKELMKSVTIKTLEDEPLAEE